MPLREGGYNLAMLQPSCEILEAALKLDPEQREGLIEELAASLDAPDLGEYWDAEIFGGGSRTSTAAK